MKEGDRVRILRDEDAEGMDDNAGQLGTIYLVDNGDWTTYLDIDLDNGDTMLCVNSIDVEVL